MIQENFPAVLGTETPELWEMNKENTDFEKILNFGKAVTTHEVTRESLPSFFEHGVIPHEWLGGARNTSFDKVVLTIVPNIEDVSDRFNKTIEENAYAKLLRKGKEDEVREKKDSITVMFIVDPASLKNNPNITKLEANGYFDPALYPSETPSGIEERSYERAREGRETGGWDGEVRISFKKDAERNLGGIKPEYWIGAAINKKDWSKLEDWISSNKQTPPSHDILKKIPVFDELGNYLGTLG